VLERLRVNSLGGRLAAMFAMVSIGTLGVVGAYLYASLDTQLRQADDAELVRTIEAARHRLLETASPQALRDKPYLFQNLASLRKNLVLILRSVQGEPLLEVNPLREPLPLMIVMPADQAFTAEALTDWRTADGVPLRLGAAYGLLSNRTDRVEIVAALVSNGGGGLLAKYGVRIIEGTVTGAIVAVLLGLVLIRAGLRPLRKVASEAATVTVNRLQTRLDAKSAPRELQDLVTAVNGMLERIEDGFQRLSQFSADVAHDLRTPISNLLGQTQVTLSKPRTVEEYQSLLASNVEEFERLARMVENMLFLARADNAQVALRKVPLDIRAELLRIAEYFEGMAEERGVAIRINNDQEDAEMRARKVELVADPILFRRAVSNLVVNAIRYTPPDGTIDLYFARVENEVIVSVRNPGPGIEREHLPHLFDRFYRTDPSRPDSALSAGLGLAIVQSIVHLHGGRVEVESDLGETVFWLVLPLGSAKDGLLPATPGA
jgi:two-component system, OmpR family, heavy metal sensor histidine kinase CusS